MTAPAFPAPNNVTMEKNLTLGQFDPNILLKSSLINIFCLIYYILD